MLQITLADLHTKFSGARPPPPQDPILSFSHAFSLKSGHIRGPWSPKTDARLPLREIVDLPSGLEPRSVGPSVIFSSALHHTQLHYTSIDATKYTTVLDVNSSQPCHIVACQCIQHSPDHALDIIVQSTQALFACQLFAKFR